MRQFAGFFPDGARLSFGAEYSGIYDALYSSKDYPGESRFVLEQLHRLVTTRPLNILDLGCGTGAHAVEFARMGNRVAGVDLSSEMIRLAQLRGKDLPDAIRNSLEFSPGDVRTVRIARKFDAVVSLFHVIGYMTTDDDVTNMLNTARAHLEKGGAFLFDFWHAPSVLDSPPPRPRTITDGTRKISRKATLDWDHAMSLVNIQYAIHVEDNITGKSTDSHETHLVRYFRTAGLRDVLAQRGFEVVHFGEWLTDEEPSDKSFGVFALCRAI